MNNNDNKFNEADIRPTELILEQKKVLDIDVNRLNSKSKEFVNVGCPACDSNVFISKFIKYSLNIVQCANCATLFTNPRPTPAILAWFYKDSANYNYWNKYIFPASEAARRQKIFIPRVDLVLELCHKLNIKTDSILEVGAAFGTFCQEMISRNVFKRVTAIEPVDSLADTCRQKGIETINQPVEEIEFRTDELFDVVVNFEVIEHLFSPKDFIKHCGRFLKDDGLLILTCPNGQGFDITVLGELSNSVDHEHLNYFNPKSIAILLENCGFEAVEILTPGQLDAELVRNKILSGEFDVSGQPWLKQVLLDDWLELGSKFQQFLREAKLSSNMMVVARRK